MTGDACPIVGGLPASGRHPTKSPPPLRASYAKSPPPLRGRVGRGVTRVPLASLPGMARSALPPSTQWRGLHPSPQPSPARGEGGRAAVDEAILPTLAVEAAQ